MRALLKCLRDVAPSSSRGDGGLEGVVSGARLAQRDPMRNAGPGKASRWCPGGHTQRVRCGKPVFSRRGFSTGETWASWPLAMTGRPRMPRETEDYDESYLLIGQPLHLGATSAALDESRLVFLKRATTDILHRDGQATAPGRSFRASRAEHEVTAREPSRGRPDRRPLRDGRASKATPWSEQRARDGDGLSFVLAT